MSQLYVDIDNIQEIQKLVSDYFDLCNDCMRDLKTLMNKVDEDWGGKDKNIYMAKFEDLYRGRSSYKEFMDSLMSYRDYLQYFCNRFNETLEWANQSGNLLRNTFHL